MGSRAAAALLAGLWIPALAAAGPLVSATLRLTAPTGALGSVPLAVTSTSATGTLVGSSFRLDAGSWFAGTHSAVNGNLRGILTLGANGALSGSLGQATISPTAGIPFFARVFIGKIPLLSFGGWPLGELTQYAHNNSFPTPPAGLVRPATHGGSFGFRGDPWHLGRVTQNRLTANGSPLPDAATTGNVSVTAAGNVHVNLVSLSRFHQVDIYGGFSYRLPLAARLELVFLPEPAPAPLLVAAAGAVASAAERRDGVGGPAAARRLKPRPRTAVASPLSHGGVAMGSFWIIGGAFGLFAMWMVGINLLWIGASAAVWLALTFNLIVAVKNAAENALGGVSVMLKKRFDLIPSLVDTVQRYMEHEQGVLEEITRLRAQVGARGVTPEQANALDGQLARAVGQLIATAESYPELKASENFQQLQRALNEVEEQISAARRSYNAATKNYNDTVQMFPTNLFAMLLGYQARAFFEAPKGHDANPDVMARFRSHQPKK